MASISKSLFILLILTSQISCAQRKAKYYTVSGTVTSTSSYCGGARPTDEMMAELAKPKPEAGKQLFLKSGKENSKSNSIIISFNSDSLGQFNIKLKNGTYCIVEEYKSKALAIPKNDENSKWDEKCLTEEYARCDYQLEVNNKNVDGVNINFHKPCQWSTPCLQYGGPLPPSAPPPGR